MGMERTFVMLKPDAVQRGLAGRVIARLEDKGLKLLAAKLMVIPKELAETHYGEHKGKPFYEPLIEYITSGPVFPMVIEGLNAITVCRTLMGKTNPQEALPGTIRGDFGMHTGRNLIHGSDGKESAAREIDIFFKPEEINEYTYNPDTWIYE